MNKRFSGTILSALLLALCLFACGPGELARDKKEKLEQFLRTMVSDTMGEDYRRHNVFIDVQVTGLTADRVSITETKEDVRYLIVGRVSYIIKGKRTWQNREGSTIELDPEQEITHWFSAGVLEDKYMGALLRDKKNPLTYHAKQPA